MSDLPYITAAYTLAWVVFCAYAVSLTVRDRRARQQLTARGEEVGHA